MKFIRRILFLLAYHLYAKRKISRSDTIELLGFKLTVAPTVFHPELFFSSKLLGSYVASLNLAGKQVLDVGTGSGIIGLCAARVGASVLSVDVNPAAVECAIQNAKQNGFANSMSLKLSDLFSNIVFNEKFDMIIWNPPFYPLEPNHHHERAWNAGDEYAIIKRFANEVGKHLLSNGTVLIVLTTDIDEAMILNFFEENDFVWSKVGERRTIFETLSLYEFRHATQ